MASSVNPIGFSTFVESCRDALDEYLPNSSSSSMEVLHSSALIHTAYNVLRNAPYSFKARDFSVNDLSHFLSSRISFLEATLVSAASTVHHLFFAVIYTMVIIATLGVAENLVRDCHHHWINFYYSFLTTNSGLVSVITPQYGSYLSLGVFVYVLNSILNDYKLEISQIDPGLYKRFKEIFNQYFAAICKWAENFYGNNQYEKEIRPSLYWLAEKINDEDTKTIHNYRDEDDGKNLLGIIYMFWKNFPEKLKPSEGYIPN